MSFEYGLSNKNKTTLIFNGFEYTKKQSTKTPVHWICRYVEEFGCKTTIITRGDTISKFSKEHCCRYVPGETEARKIVAAMKETSLYTSNTDAIATSLASVSETSCVQLSMLKKTPITQTRHRQKNNMNELPVLPHNKKFELPEEFKDFLIYDSGTEDPERFLIFGQQTLLELLESTQYLWLADGTFKFCPEIFFQLFTIHTSINGYKPPCIYALLPNKHENNMNVC